MRHFDQASYVPVTNSRSDKLILKVFLSFIRKVVCQ